VEHLVVLALCRDGCNHGCSDKNLRFTIVTYLVGGMNSQVSEQFVKPPVRQYSRTVTGLLAMRKCKSGNKPSY
ncbi:hypothetical protein, partial [Haloferax volcanii]|uniref:hypothetical protein n=1 Tax=Haloferax volcanii TaxID=2246 RepID=UPI001C9534C1